MNDMNRSLTPQLNGHIVIISEFTKAIHMFNSTEQDHVNVVKLAYTAISTLGTLMLNSTANAKLVADACPPHIVLKFLLFMISTLSNAKKQTKHKQAYYQQLISVIVDALHVLPILHIKEKCKRTFMEVVTYHQSRPQLSHRA